MILELPKGDTPERKATLLEVLDTLLKPGMVERNVRQVGWWMTNAYLSGQRYFDVIDWESGTVEMPYEDQTGRLRLKWDEALTKIQTEVGRLAQLDTAPLVKKYPFSLQSLRASSTAQVLLDGAIRPHQPDLLKMYFLTMLVLYGTGGLTAWDNAYDDSNPIAQIPEFIPPWELVSVPSGLMLGPDLKAVCRTRLYPLNCLDRVPGFDDKSKFTEEQLEIMELPVGLATAAQSGQNPYPWQETNMESSSISKMAQDAVRNAEGLTMRGKKPKIDTDDPRTQKYVKLREWYLRGPEETLARYISTAGRAIGLDQDFRDQSTRVPWPIGIAYYDYVGRFYGRSFASKIIPFMSEMEQMLERLIQNTDDQDRMGLLVLPTSSGFNLHDLGDQGTGLPRILTTEPDYNTGKLPVEKVQPIGASDIPGRTMQFCIGLTDRLVSQGPLYGGTAPGRAESGEAFSILAETGSTHLLPKAISIESAWTTMYRCMLYNIKDRMGTMGASIGGTYGEAGGIPVPLTKVDSGMAGVKIDLEAGTAVIDPKNVPTCWEVDISIRSRDPAFRERQKQEGWQMFSSGVIDRLKFVVANYRNNWGYPLESEDIWEQYVAASLINLILFGDGETPGQLPGNIMYLPQADQAAVHKLAHSQFVAGIHFRLASDDVRARFMERFNLLDAKMGNTIPNGGMSLDQSAEVSAMMGGGMGGMGMGGGMGSMGGMGGPQGPMGVQGLIS